MLIFMIIVMGPALGFMMYVLRQFREEATRFSCRRKAELPKGITSATAPDPLDEEHPRRAWDTPAGRAVSTNSPGVLEFAPGVASPAHEKVVATYIKSRVIVLPSEMGRPAVKRAAKGSF